MTVHMSCPTDGNAGVIAFCQANYPTGADLTEPVHQGIFDLNTGNDNLKMIAQTGENGFTDFLNWNFSGQVSSTDGEPARWRSAAYVADSKGNVIFTGQSGALDGLYLGDGTSPLQTLLTTNSLGQSVDPMAPAGSIVSSIGLERDGFRGDRLAISVGMLDPLTQESWAGIYTAAVPELSTWAMLLFGFAGLGIAGYYSRGSASRLVPLLDMLC